MADGADYNIKEGCLPWWNAKEGKWIEEAEMNLQTVTKTLIIDLIAQLRKATPVIQWFAKQITWIGLS